MLVKEALALTDYTLRPIPVLDDLKQYENYDFIDSPLVQVENSKRIDIAMQYPALGFRNSESRCLLRKEVAEMLQKVAKLLPDGYKFRIWDAWRPFELQKELFVSYSAKLIETFNLANETIIEQEEFVENYVARPISDKKLPPAHTTGGAIDLTIVGPEGKELNMGGEFDSFDLSTRAGYFETDTVNEIPNADKIRKNRRLLYNIMLDAGFTNLPSEWWHFEYGDKNWAYVTKKPAIYDGIFEFN